MTDAGQPVQVYRYGPGGWETQEMGVISETPVSLTVNGQVWLTFLCTPTLLEELAVGFLFTEDLIHSIEDVADVRVCEHGGNVDVWLRREVKKPEQWRRTSGCTGGLTQAEPAPPLFTARHSPKISTGMILTCMDQLLQAQELYRVMRGVHCSGLSDGETLHLHAEDIGRHNTLDKLAGLYLMRQPVLERKIIVTTGRISSEMLHKSARLGASTVVSRTAPSLLSVELARETGITLVGYARRNQFNVYTHPERLVEDGVPAVLPSVYQAAD